MHRYLTAIWNLLMKTSTMTFTYAIFKTKYVFNQKESYRSKIIISNQPFSQTNRVTKKLPTFTLLYDLPCTLMEILCPLWWHKQPPLGIAHSMRDLTLVKICFDPLVFIYLHFIWFYDIGQELPGLTCWLKSTNDTPTSIYQNES